MPGTVAITTHGCKLNQADSAALARQFAQAGCRPVDDHAAADIIVVNTCTVTAAADSKARQALRAARRANPDAIVVAAGCYPQRAAAELRQMPEVSLVVGNQDKPQLAARALAEWNRRHNGPIANAANATATAAATAAGILRRTRAMVKIQEGCDQVCAYCIVPKVRGRERSIPPDELIAAIQSHSAAGFREATLTGTQLGTYGFDLNGIDLPRLLDRILSETDLPRLRVSSLQAHEIGPDLLSRWQNPRLCPHFHVPLQSGCDATLRAMRRRYDAAAYRRAVSLIRDTVPAAAITADVIVGFPGETDAHHAASLALVAAMQFADTHIFPYSPRPGTTAYYLSEPVAPAVKRRRAAAMADAAAAGFTAWRNRMAGQTRPVLWESARANSPAGNPAADAGDHALLWRGLTDNYIRVAAPSRANLAGRITPARLGPLADDRTVSARVIAP